MGRTCYFCFMVPLRHAEAVDTVDLNRVLKPGTAFYKTLEQYMYTVRSTVIGLFTMQCKPTSFNKAENVEPYASRFPVEYVHEFEGYLAQGAWAVAINDETKEAIAHAIDTKEKYNSALATMFVQSVQHLNPFSSMLYDLANSNVLKNLSKEDEANICKGNDNGYRMKSGLCQCCVKRLIAVMAYGPHGEIVIKLKVSRHVGQHNGPINFQTVTRWLC